MSDTSADTPAAPSTAGDGGGNDTGSAGGGDGANFTRPTSYFSNVRSNAYRKGWHDIFGGDKNTPKRKRRNKGKTKSPAASLPLTLRFDDGDLDDALRAGLEKALKKRARKNGITLGYALRKARVEWDISCRLSE